MYNYIIGKIDYVDAGYIVIDNNGIGYNINVANPYSYNIGEEYKIYTYYHQTEYEGSLFGFKTREEKNLFLRLINVKGLGPKVALPMFASSSIEGIIDAIDRENILYLTKFPKIGDKLARQIILDLKGKLTASKNEVLSINNEVVEALESLGYKAADIKKVLPKIDNTLKIEDQIKAALKLMMK